MKKIDEVASARIALKEQFEALKDKTQILKSAEIKNLYAMIRDVPNEEKKEFGQAINQLKTDVRSWLDEAQSEDSLKDMKPIDVTAPFDVNVDSANRSNLLNPKNGSKHPLTAELEIISSIFQGMGFTIEDSRQIDNDYNMFTALNFPLDHPARDDYDTFLTDEGLIPPAHTSTMQNRILHKYAPPIRSVVPGRVFRNEDLDARHEHTFHQVEGVYVDKGISLSHMLGTIQKFLEIYFGQSLEFKTQPFYFPFVEPGLEYLISCPFCQKKGCNVCSKSGWMEIMGCGMIHPDVLKMGGIDPVVYSGFAWGFGVERLVMIKNGIEDIRHFHGGNLEFLRKF